MAELLSFVSRIMTNPIHQWTAIIVAGSLMVVSLFLRSLKVTMLFAIILFLAFFLWIKGPSADQKIDNLQKQYAPHFKMHDGGEAKAK